MVITLEEYRRNSQLIGLVEKSNLLHGGIRAHLDVRRALLKEYGCGWVLENVPGNRVMNPPSEDTVLKISVKHASPEAVLLGFRAIYYQDVEENREYEASQKRG